MAGNDLVCAGSVDDIRNSLRFAVKTCDVAYLEEALAYERKHQNRASVIKMLEPAIRRKRKESHSIKWYFLYANVSMTKFAVFQAHTYAMNEKNAREEFSKLYAADLLAIRNDHHFSRKEIREASEKLRKEAGNG